MKLLTMIQEKSDFVQFQKNFKEPPFYGAKISKTKILVKFYSFIRTLKRNQEMQWFLDKISDESHVKFENTKKKK